MGIAHVAVAAQCCTFEIWDGDIDDAEVHAHLVRLAADANWPPGALNLVDLSTVGTIRVPDPELVSLLREGTILEQELKTALVVPGELTHRTTDRYEESARATGVTVFGDLPSAAKHLGLPIAVSLRVMDDLRQSL